MKTAALISVLVVSMLCGLRAYAGNLAEKPLTLRQVSTECGALGGMVTIAPLAGLDLDTGIVTENRAVLPWGPVRTVSVPDYFSVEFECNTGKVSFLYLSPSKLPTHLEPFLTREQMRAKAQEICSWPILTREQALAKAQEFLNALGVTEDFTSPKTGPAPMQGKYRGLTSLWTFSTPHIERGIECGGIGIKVCAVSGTVVEYSNTIRKPPEALTAKITKQQAIEIALRYATERNRDVSEAQINRAALLYGSAKDPSQPAKANEPAKFLPDLKLQWIIRFQDQQDIEDGELGWLVAIDALTGEVLGEG